MGLSRQSALLLLSAAMMATAAAGFAVAGPNGGTVVGGNATIQGQGTGSVTINQSSQSTIINWATFNIGRGETTTFNQPNSTSTALNRVIGGQGPSFLDGTLTANGRVFIVNGDGILFGAHSSINTAGFLASTNDIRNEDFMAGKYNFNIPGLPNASIVNLGSITATSGGFAALVAPGVRNAGTITATLGTVSLAAGNAFTLDFYGDRLITLAVNDQIAGAVKDVQTGQTLKSLVSNSGKLSANGGRVELTAAAARAVVDSVINNSGVIEANSIGTRNGMIVLSAATGASKPAGAPTQVVKLSGQISAAGKDKGTKGGTVVVTGETIALAGVTIDASGDAGGGHVLIGGDTGGGNPSAAAASIELAKLESFVIPTATTVSVDAGTIINASATGTGNGGKVVLWSDQQTTFAGTILAQGGTAGGNGGFVETSSHTLDFTGGRVNTSAPIGSTGTWLLDPTNLTIDSTAASTISSNLATTSVVVQTNADGTTSGAGTASSGLGDIIVGNGVTLSWASANTLTLNAYNNIQIDRGSTIASSGGGNLILRADNTGTGTGTVIFQSDGPGHINMSGGGTVSIYYNPCFGCGDIKYSNPANYSGFVSGSMTAYMLVNNVTDLQNINQNVGTTGIYALGKNIDASATATWNEGAGFVPIASGGAQFSGIFNGQGYAIADLTIYRPNEDSVGLFGNVGSAASIQNVGLIAASVTGQSSVGALVGSNAGTVTQSYATGAVAGVGAVGGLVGSNGGTVTQSYATSNATATGGDDVGGLVGYNYRGTVTQSYASGAVSGPLDVGGLIGDNSYGTVTQSYATGPVSGTNTAFGFGVGGLVGYLYGGSVAESYASGAVTGSAYVGGLVGWNAGSVTQSYALGSVSGSSNVGGLVGYNNGSVSQVYATGLVNAPEAAPNVGGLVGWNDSSGNVTQSYWDTTIAGSLPGVGLNNEGNFSASGLATSGFMTASNFEGWSFGGTGGTSCAKGGACWVIVDGDGSVNNAGGKLGATRPFLISEFSTTISNSHQLQLAVLQPNASYTLANDISLGSDLQNPSSMWSAAGFVPISNISGTFNGQNHTIDGLTVAPTDSSVNSVGLFGAIYGSVSNLTLSNVTITANPNVGSVQSIGALAGQNWGSIINVAVISAGDFTSTVDGGSQSGLSAGGLAGFNLGTITGSTAAVRVTVGDGTICSGTGCTVGGLNFAGGLVGNNSTNNSFGGMISSSSASGNVSGGNNSIVGGLVGENTGAINSSSATGDVSVTTSVSPDNNNFSPSFAGGLVGQNGNGGLSDNIGTITSSWASGNVTGTGLALAIGGLTGDNSAGSFITDSQAFGGKVIASTDATPQSQFGNSVNAGGLVGYNQGTVQGSTAPSLASSCSVGVAFSCAGGDVKVSALGLAGGLIGNNDGTLVNVLATGAVTGAAGFPSGINGSHNHGSGNQDPTLLGGLVGENTGTIGYGFATGAVGTLGVAYLQVGGLVADNSGSIGYSAAKGVVTAGDNSTAGGLMGNNSPNDCGGCTGGTLGTGHSELATVLSSSASGDVTVGASSFAGGLSGTGDGSFSDTQATGNVSGGANSLLGGLVGGMGAFNGPSFITLSSASGTVTSTGSNSTVGGLVGLNGGTINQSQASGAIFGTSQSYLGGLVGINVGWIHDSSAAVPVSGSGSQNFAGGVAGLNFGLIDPTTSSGNVSSGPNSVVGGLVGGNGAFSNFLAGQLLGSSFPVGTISSDSLATGSASGGTGSTVGPQVGENYPTSGLPAYPSSINGCGNVVCDVLVNGQLYNPTEKNPSPSPSPPPPPPPPTTQAQLIQNLVQDITLASVTLGEVVDTQPLTQPPAGPPPAGSGPPPAPGGLPPQFGARFFTPPPLGETRFIKDEVVLQIPSGITPAQLQAIFGPLGLSILGSQTMGLIGVTSYRVHIGNGASIASVIQALAAKRIVAGAQANYTYSLVQDHAPAAPELAQDPDLAGLTQGEGDAAQYAIGKLGLIDIHRQLKGGNITVAVIDSQIDVKHPDLDGVVAEQFDAVGAADLPHSHGTGMAGAIFAHRKLMGVAPAARLYAIHAFSSGAASAESTTFNILKSLEWASSKGVRVINMSFAGPRDPSLERALKAAHDKGIVLIAAAGNAGPKSPPLYPGADPNVIAVTATDVNDKLFTGANRGSYIAVAAPGVDVLVPGPDDTYQLTTGTSVASAEVSGLAALLLERNPNLTPDEVRKVLTSSARRLGTRDRDDNFGSGLIDPSKAIQTAGDLKSVDFTGAVAPRPAPAQKPQPARAPVLNVNQPNGTSPRPTR